MAAQKAARELTLGDDLPEHEASRLRKKQLRRTKQVLAAPEFPPPDHKDLEFTDTPADFTHPAAHSSRPTRKSKLRGAKLR